MAKFESRLRNFLKLSDFFLQPDFLLPQTLTQPMLCLMLRDLANAHPQTTHLKILQANPLPKFLKKLFFPSQKESLVII